MTAVASVATLGALLLTACAADEDVAPEEEADQEVEQDEAQDAGDDSAGHDSAEHNAADVDYAHGMIAHHEQAVEMSDILLENDDLRPELEALAEDVKAAQGPEIDQMNAWLEAWEGGEHADHDAEGHGPDEQDDSDGHDGDRGHRDHGGMLSEDQLQELVDAEGAEAERLFLDGMILHHEGAVDMAERHLEAGENTEALELSEQVIADQSEEIDLMEGLLEDY